MGHGEGEVLLTLAPASSSAAEARQAAVSAVRTAGQPELAGDVGVVVSELVTNAVLHAQTKVDVRIQVLAQGVRVEVLDDGTGVPVSRAPSQDPDDLDLETTTGRGLLIVDAIADAWGAVPGPHGKVVWAEVGTGRRHQPADPDTRRQARVPVLEPESGQALMPIRLVAVPARLIIASEHNLGELQRELEVAQLAGTQHPASVLLQRARTLLADYGQAVAIARRAARATWDDGRRLVDLNLAVPLDTPPRLREAVGLLDEVAAHSRAGDLLSVAPSDELIAFRRWCADEVERQLDGAPPTPCPFPVVEPIPTTTSQPAPTSTHTRDDLSEAATRSARMLLELQSVTAALAGADDTQSVTDIALTRVAGVVGALSSSLSLLAPDGETLELAGTSGFSANVSSHWSTYLLSADLPASEAVRTGTAVYLHSHDELVANYPSLRGRPVVGSEAVAVLPLLVADGRVLGAIAFGYGKPRAWLPEDRAVLGLVADALAQALDRARLHDSERVAAERLTFLAEASELLSRSLDASTAMTSLASLAVPRLGDWCSIHLLENQRPVLAALAAVDEEKRSLAERLHTEWPPTLGEGSIGRCLVDGASGVWQVLPDELLPRIAQDDEHLAVLQALGLGSGLVVPLLSGGEVIGALAVANASGKVIQDSDLSLAQDLALRAGAAIENARLFDQQRGIAHALQQSLLPSDTPEVDGLELGVAYEAAGVGEEVGGDFYDLMPLDAGLLVTIGDVRGRGIQAAALTGLARHTIRALGRLGLPPDEVLRQLHLALRDSTPTDDAEAAFCTALTGRIESVGDRRRLLFASGGHPAPFLLRAGATGVQRPSVRGDLLGVLDEVELPVTEVPLGPGDLVVLVTDGVLERRRDGVFFDDDGVAQVLLAERNLPADQLAQQVARAAQGFSTDATSDDMAVVVVRVAAP